MTWLPLLWVAAFAQSDETLAESIETRHERILETVLPSVVSVEVEREAERRERGAAESANPFRKRPGGTASGIVIDSNGYILTSYFNVKGKVRKLGVVLHDGTQHEAQLLGYDGALDVALLKIEARDLRTIGFADPEALVQGQPVFAVGRAPGSGGPTLNPGVLSALDRFGGRMLQTDARLNYSNVGGPLVNERGEMVGVTCKVNTAFAFTFGQNSGVGFAALWSRVAEIMPRLKQGARRLADRRPYLGIMFDAEWPGEGLKILDVHPDASADKAKIVPDDVLTELDGTKLASSSDLRKVMNRLQVGEKVKVKVRRGDEELDLEIELLEAETRD